MATLAEAIAAKKAAMEATIADIEKKAADDVAVMKTAISALDVDAKDLEEFFGVEVTAVEDKIKAFLAKL